MVFEVPSDDILLADLSTALLAEPRDLGLAAKQIVDQLVAEGKDVETNPAVFACAPMTLNTEAKRQILDAAILARRRRTRSTAARRDPP